MTKQMRAEDVALALTGEVPKMWLNEKAAHLIREQAKRIDVLEKLLWDLHANNFPLRERIEEVL